MPSYSSRYGWIGLYTNGVVETWPEPRELVTCEYCKVIGPLGRCESCGAPHKAPDRGVRFGTRPAAALVTSATGH